MCMGFGRWLFLIFVTVKEEDEDGLYTLDASLLVQHVSTETI